LGLKYVAKRREENQLDATECFIALIICSTYFWHLYAHHQELETILALLPHMVCNALVGGGRLLGAEQQAMRPDEGDCATQFPSSRTHSLLPCLQQPTTTNQGMTHHMWQ